MKKGIFLVFFIIINSVQLISAEFTLASVHAPHTLIKAEAKANKSISKPSLFVEIQVGSDIVWRSMPQNIAGLKKDFYFNEKFALDDNSGKVVIYILIGEKKAIERSLRAASGGISGAVIGGLICGVAAGCFSGGLGAPAGAAIGAAIGGGTGVAASQLFPIANNREIASFSFFGLSSIKGEHLQICEDDILLEGKKIKIIIQ